MHHHLRDVCRDHGTVLMQCRCIAPKINRLVACPGEWCAEKASALFLSAQNDPVCPQSQHLPPPSAPRWSTESLQRVLYHVVSRYRDAIDSNQSIPDELLHSAIVDVAIPTLKDNGWWPEEAEQRWFGTG